MKAQRTTTEITVETHQILVVRRQRLTRFWCNQCGCEADFVSTKEVGHLLEESAKSSRVLPTKSTPHLATARDGSVVICVKSLLGGG